MSIDLTHQANYLLAFLPEIVLSVAAMLVLLVDVFLKGDRSEPSRPIVAWLTLIGIAASAVANGWILGLHAASTDGMVALDAFRVFTNYLFLLAAALFVLLAQRYLEEEHMSLGELYSLVLFAVVGMMVFAGSQDLVLTFIGLELLSVSVYVLTGANRRDRRSAEAALKYFLLGAFSSAFFLFGVALVYGGAGSVNLARIATIVGSPGSAVVGGPAGSSSGPLLLIGMGLLAVGFAFKVAAVPFHMWTPDAYEGAPAPITAFMAAAVKAAAFAAFIRVFFTAFPGMYSTWGVIAVWLAAATMIVANLIALVETNVKRMLAYSSIAHAGYLLVAVAAAGALGGAAFLFYLVVYTLMTIGAFGVLIVVGQAGEEHLSLESYSGLGWRQPFLGAVMTLFLLSLAGFPFTGGFIGKVYILQAALGKGLVALAVLLVATSLLSYYYYLRVAWYMWFREPPRDAERLIVAPGLRVALAIAVIGVVLLGVYPSFLLGVAHRSALALLGSGGAALGLAP